MCPALFGAVRRRLGAAGECGHRLRTTARRLGMSAYHRATALNYDARLFARRRVTSAGPYHSHELIASHASDHLLRALAATADPDATIYDIGAYAGSYALPLAATEPDRTVIAFEPDAVSRQRLRANRDRTAPAGDLFVQPVGVGATAGRRPFYRSSFPKLSSFDRADATRWGASVRRVVSVPVRTLDDLTSLPPPDQIKIDVEGLAPAVLSGATRTITRHRPTLFVEPHDRPGANRTASVFDWCADHGYRVVAHHGMLICRPE